MTRQKVWKAVTSPYVYEKLIFLGTEGEIQLKTEEGWVSQRLEEEFALALYGTALSIRVSTMEEPLTLLVSLVKKGMVYESRFKVMARIWQECQEPPRTLETEVGASLYMPAKPGKRSHGVVTLHPDGSMTIHRGKESRRFSQEKTFSSEAIFDDKKDAIILSRHKASDPLRVVIMPKDPNIRPWAETYRFLNGMWGMKNSTVKE